MLLVKVVDLGKVEHIDPAQGAVAPLRNLPFDRLGRFGISGVAQNVEQGLGFAHGCEIILKGQPEKALKPGIRRPVRHLSIMPSPAANLWQLEPGMPQS
jgi:hypothetical protein